MRIFDYMQSSEKDKVKWMESFQITTGLRYFGGKNTVGKYLMNRICNMAVKMQMDGKPADTFIDAFTGGGKLALSIPEGWFNTIVMNDLNYGVYSYFICCKHNHKELIKMIEYIGQYMNKDIYYFIAFNRANNGVTSNREEAEELAALYVKAEAQEKEKADKLYNDIATIRFLSDIKRKRIEGELSQEDKEDAEKFSLIIENLAKNIKRRAKIAYSNRDMIVDERVDELVAAAMTYWVTQMNFLGQTDPYEVTYTGENGDNKAGLVSNISEKEKIERAINHAKRQIPKISKKLNKNNIIIENLDYRELIKKYNGLEYVDTYGQHHKANKKLEKNNKLWYFDPPYHPATLYAGQEAPYEDKFSWGMCSEMVEILTNKKVDVYGELEYFIKSDYDPKDTYRQFDESYNTVVNKLLKLRSEYFEIWEREGIQDVFDALVDDGKTAYVKIKEDEKDKEIKKRIAKMLNYGYRMKQQKAYSKLAYHDFDLLEENCRHKRISRPISRKNSDGIPRVKKIKNIHQVSMPIYYKECLGKFDKGITDEETGEKLKGTEFIWCRGNLIPTKEMIKLKKWYKA